MSIIIKALKRLEEEPPGSESLPNGEGFFKGKQAFIKKSPTKNKRVYVLATVFVALLAVAIAVKWHRAEDTKMEVAAPDEMSVLSRPEIDKPAGEEQRSSDDQQPAIAAQQPSAADGAERAYAAFDSGNYDEAVNLFREAIKNDPDNAELHNGLGLVFVNKELYSSAEDEYKRALELNSGCAECFNNFGYLKSLLGEAVEAKKYLEKATLLSTTYADPYFNLAVLYEKEGDIGNSVKNYRKFVGLYPNKTDGLIERVSKRIFELAGK